MKAQFYGIFPIQGFSLQVFRFSPSGRTFGQSVD